MSEHNFHEHFSNITHKGEEALKDFLHKANQEVGQTKEAGLILKRYAEGHSISIEEKEIVRVQVYDLFKIVGIGIPFALVPGASIILPFLIHVATKHNISLLPSAFSKKE